MFTEFPTVPYQRFRFAGGIVVEVARFVLAAGVTEADLVSASTRMQQECEAVRGFLGRLLTKDERDVYLDILYWTQDAVSLVSTTDRAELGPGCAAYLACLAEPSGDLPAVDPLLQGIAISGHVAGLKS